MYAELHIQSIYTVCRIKYEDGHRHNLYFKFTLYTQLTMSFDIGQFLNILRQGGDMRKSNWKNLSRIQF